MLTGLASRSTKPYGYARWLRRALNTTCITVAKTLLKLEAILLPSVHDFFMSLVQEHTATGDLKGGEEHVTARFILSHLIVTLGKHLSYMCKTKKYGTLLYCTNGDVMTSLTIALYKGKKENGAKLTEEQSGNTPCTSDYEFMMDINSRIHQQICNILQRDESNPLALDLDHEIAAVDQKLWSLITTMTLSQAERKGSSRATYDSSFHRTKQIRFYCLCCLLFCTDNRCYFPLHNLITDTIESQGGSAMLVRILNTLGACSSADTLARTVQQHVAEREQRGPEYDCSPATYTIVSVDNIDFMHGYAKVFCGNQASS